MREGYHLSEAASQKSSGKQSQAKIHVAKHSGTVRAVLLSTNQTDNPNSSAAFPTPNLKTILGKMNKQKEKQRLCEIKEKPTKPFPFIQLRKKYRRERISKKKN